MTGWEMIFILFAFAFTLEEYTASTEHGWISKNASTAIGFVLMLYSLCCQCRVTTSKSFISTFQLILSQLWNVFDFSFIAILITYLCLRVKGLSQGDGDQLLHSPFSTS